MSHFAVLVIGDNVDGQMAKYDENMQVTPYWEPWYVGEDYNSQKAFAEWCEKEGHFKEADEFDRRCEYVTAGTEWSDPQADYEPSEALLELLRQWHGGFEPNFRYRDGRWEQTTTYNPESKWDWFVVGGRWQGYFRLKERKDSPQEGLGDPSFFNTPLEAEEQAWLTDVATKGEIDFEAMRANAILSAEERYDMYEAADKDEKKGLEFQMFWPDGVVSRHDYIAKHQNPWIPYALVKDGKWYGKGDMGWWGLSSNESDDWADRAQEAIDALDDDVTFTMLDCHI